jgi:hypothetical protein
MTNILICQFREWKKKYNEDQLVLMYLDFRSNYGSLEKFANDYQMDCLDEAAWVIGKGKGLHEGTFYKGE